LIHGFVFKNNSHGNKNTLYSLHTRWQMYIILYSTLFLRPQKYILISIRTRHAVRKYSDTKILMSEPFKQKYSDNINRRKLVKIKFTYNLNVKKRSMLTWTVVQTVHGFSCEPIYVPTTIYRQKQWGPFEGRTVLTLYPFLPNHQRSFNTGRIVCTIPYIIYTNTTPFIGG